MRTRTLVLLALAVVLVAVAAMALRADDASLLDGLMRLHGR